MLEDVIQLARVDTELCVAVVHAGVVYAGQQRYRLHWLGGLDHDRRAGEVTPFVERAGLQLLERLRARGDDPRFVFYTSARSAELYRSEALAAGAFDMVADPGADERSGSCTVWIESTISRPG